MFGKLFNQKKDGETQETQMPPDQSMSQEQSQQPSIHESPRQTPPPATSNYQSSQQNQDPQGGHPGAGLPKGQSVVKIDMSALSHLDPRASLVLTTRRKRPGESISNT